jgi:hypothetical protein
MNATDLIVEKQSIGNVRLVPSRPASPSDGQISVAVDRIGLTSNNLSYAAAGEMLGYWSFFPTDDPRWGVVPAWGFATVTESRHPDVASGEELFGFFPMGRRLLLQPTDVTATTFGDRFEHRAELHPWYNRYYRTAADPATIDRWRHLQPVLWALHMTGWMLALEFGENDDFGADHVLVASASSKTAVAFAHSMSELERPSELIGLTSRANAAVVEQLSCYDRVLTYDELDLSPFRGTAALVDMSGNSSVVGAIHHAFSDRLTQSIRIGATHLGAGGDTGVLPGPAQRFFFIPDVAEAEAARVGFDRYHHAFATAWESFAAWVDPHLTISEGQGVEALRDAYLAALSGRHDPATATVITL